MKKVAKWKITFSSIQIACAFTFIRTKKRINWWKRNWNKMLLQIKAERNFVRWKHIGMKLKDPVCLKLFIIIKQETEKDNRIQIWMRILLK